MLKVIAAQPVTTAPAKIYNNQDRSCVFIETDTGTLYDIATGERLTNPGYQVEQLTTIEHLLVVGIANEFVRFRDIPVGATFVHRGFHYLNTVDTPVHIDCGVCNSFAHRLDTFCQLTEVVIMYTGEVQSPVPATETTEFKFDEFIADLQANNNEVRAAMKSIVQSFAARHNIVIS